LLVASEQGEPKLVILLIASEQSEPKVFLLLVVLIEEPGVAIALERSVESLPPFVEICSD
jgi:hypothetical protein